MKGQMLVARLLLVVYLTRLGVSQQYVCHDGVPDDCQSLRWCGWEKDDTLSFDEHDKQQYVTLSGRDRAEGNLTSRTVCSTKGKSHCLEFRYRFEHNNILELNVYTKETDKNGILAWSGNGSSNNSWETARVCVQTNSNFTIVFELKRNFKTENGDSVQISSINYTQSPCSSCALLQPPHPTETPNSSVIIGIVLAALFFIVLVVVVIVIVCRKKQLQLGLFHFTSHSQRENTSSGSLSSTHTGLNDRVNSSRDGDKAHHLSAYDNHLLDTLGVQSGSKALHAEDSQAVEPSCRDVEAHTYEEVNKPKKQEYTKLSNETRLSRNNHYEIVDVDVLLTPRIMPDKPEKINKAEPFQGRGHLDERSTNGSQYSTGTEDVEEDIYSRLNRNGRHGNGDDDCALVQGLPVLASEYNHLDISIHKETVSENQAPSEQHRQDP